MPFHWRVRASTCRPSLSIRFNSPGDAAYAPRPVIDALTIRDQGERANQKLRNADQFAAIACNLSASSLPLKAYLPPRCPGPPRVPSSVVFSQSGSLFTPDLTNSAPCIDIETSPHCDPLADLFDSGGNLWHTSFGEEPCDCGNGARSGFAHHSAHFEVFCTSRLPVRWMLLAHCGLEFEQGVCLSS